MRNERVFTKSCGMIRRVNHSLWRCAGHERDRSGGEMLYPGLTSQCSTRVCREMHYLPFLLHPFPIHMGTGKICLRASPALTGAAAPDPRGSRGLSPLRVWAKPKPRIPPSPRRAEKGVGGRGLLYLCRQTRFVYLSHSASAYSFPKRTKKSQSGGSGYDAGGIV